MSWFSQIRRTETASKGQTRIALSGDPSAFVTAFGRPAC